MHLYQEAADQVQAELSAAAAVPPNLIPFVTEQLQWFAMNGRDGRRACQVTASGPKRLDGLAASGVAAASAGIGQLRPSSNADYGTNWLAGGWRRNVDRIAQRYRFSSNSAPNTTVARG